MIAGGAQWNLEGGKQSSFPRGSLRPRAPAELGFFLSIPERFQNLLKGLLAVPRKELQEKLDHYREEKKKTSKQKRA
jgi:hypothetical protein